MRHLFVLNVRHSQGLLTHSLTHSLTHTVYGNDYRSATPPSLSRSLTYPALESIDVILIEEHTLPSLARFQTAHATREDTEGDDAAPVPGNRHVGLYG